LLVRLSVHLISDLPATIEHDEVRVVGCLVFDERLPLGLVVQHGNKMVALVFGNVTLHSRDHHAANHVGNALKNWQAIECEARSLAEIGFHLLRPGPGRGLRSSREAEHQDGNFTRGGIRQNNRVPCEVVFLNLGDLLGRRQGNRGPEIYQHKYTSGWSELEKSFHDYTDGFVR